MRLREWDGTEAGGNLGMKKREQRGFVEVCIIKGEQYVGGSRHGGRASQEWRTSLRKTGLFYAGGKKKGIRGTEGRRQKGKVSISGEGGRCWAVPFVL